MSLDYVSSLNEPCKQHDDAKYGIEVTSDRINTYFGTTKPGSVLWNPIPGSIVGNPFILASGCIVVDRGIYLPAVSSVIFHEPYTIIKWNDGTKTVIRALDGDEFNEEVGLAMAIARRYCEDMDGSAPRSNFRKLLAEATRYVDPE